MTLVHPKIKKIISETQAQIRELTGNDSIYITVQSHANITLDFELLVEFVCHATSVPFNDAIKKTRRTKERRTRQLISFYAYDCCGMTLKEIGEALGGQDHTTAMAARNKIKDLIEANDTEVCRYVTMINTLLNNI